MRPSDIYGTCDDCGGPTRGGRYCRSCYRGRAGWKPENSDTEEEIEATIREQSQRLPSWWQRDVSDSHAAQTPSIRVLRTDRRWNGQYVF